MGIQASLWTRHAAGDAAAREALLAEHLNLVHHVARQLSRTLAAYADFDELVSAGAMGLMNALDHFDAGRGLAFSTFAVPRIRGSILDELRRLDHVPRSIRRKSRDIGTAREALTRTLGRMPDDRLLAGHLGVDLDTLWRWQSDVEGAVHIPLDRSNGEGEEYAPAPAELIADGSDVGIEDRVTMEQEVAALRDAILKLRKQERIVLSLYYFEELKLHEIAVILELTESRVSQIRTKALSRLRTQLGALRADVT
ncbi:MAG TPA: FliA/WhiG family RNA polymerase sigma factor [Gemmatimonadaceae bacterium]|nr:FliA/WhiG family RNA polymerase sigma factor [Gemmatimonadaceae bacterium]